MNTAEQNIANDYKVVSFHNAEAFDFTPSLGCMYDGRAINGSKDPGIAAGETKMLPYHVGMRLATNLAKYVMISQSSGKPETDAQGNPMVKAIWDEGALESKKHSYVTEMYSEDKPAAQSQTDVLFERIKALEALVLAGVPAAAVPVAAPEVVAPVAETVGAQQANAVVPPAVEDPTASFKDKQEVLAELEKRNIPHDKRASKEKLESLLK